MGKALPQSVLALRALVRAWQLHQQRRSRAERMQHLLVSSQKIVYNKIESGAVWSSGFADIKKQQEGGMHQQGPLFIRIDHGCGICVAVFQPRRS